MIEVHGLRKTFGSVKAVDGIDFEVKEGELFGLLGPNGAGKTTTISMLCGLLEADSGSVKISGMDIGREGKRIRQVLGVIPQEIALYEELTARENLHFWGGLYGLTGSELREAAARVLDLVELTERADDRVGTYSGGMKRRINLCVGLIHSPKIVLLDEPTLGIDPQARIRILEIVRDRVAGGTTVIYTTHYLEEAESLCDRIAIIDHGHILAEGTLQELVKLIGEENIVTVAGVFEKDQIGGLLQGVKADHIETNYLRVLVPGTGAIGQFLERLFAAGLQINDISIKEPNLESVFIKLTGRELRD